MYKRPDLILKHWNLQVLYSCAISLAIQLPDTCISKGTIPPPHTLNMTQSEEQLLNCDSRKCHKVWHNAIMSPFDWTEKEPCDWSFKINEYINYANLYSAWIRPAHLQTVSMLMNHLFCFVFFYILINRILKRAFYHVNQLTQNQAVVLYRLTCQSPPLVSTARGDLLYLYISTKVNRCFFPSMLNEFGFHQSAVLFR